MKISKIEMCEGAEIELKKLLEVLAIHKCIDPSCSAILAYLHKKYFDEAHPAPSWDAFGLAFFEKIMAQMARFYGTAKIVVLNKEDLNTLKRQGIIMEGMGWGETTFIDLIVIGTYEIKPGEIFIG